MINLSKLNEQHPPLRFQIEVDIKQNNNNNGKIKYSCKLCASHKQKFICRRCMSNGNFTFENSDERFIDKEHKLKNIIQSSDSLNRSFKDKFKNYIKLENLRLSLIKYRNNNALLRDLVKEKQKNIQKLVDMKKENHDKNRSMRIILPKYEDKVNKLGEYVAIAIEKNDDLRKKSNEQIEKLRLLRRENIEKLTKYIFPITLKERNNSNTDSNITLGSSSDSNSSREYIISNGPSLPINRNYFFEYCKWLVYNSSSSTAGGNNNDEGAEMTHKAYAIVAALTYIVQLINSLSIYLDVRLPHKITCNDFCKVILNEQQFRRKVSKLNYNVAYFAYTQSVLKSNVQSCSIMENVMQIVSDRKEDCQIIDSISLSFTDINDNASDIDSENEDEDDDDVQKLDWENVSNNIPIAEIASHSLAMPHESNSIAMSSTIMNNITNVANSLFWNRWNKN